LKSSSDKLLWQQIQLGNADAFRSLYDSHIDDLIVFGQKLCKDNGLIQDTLQLLFLKLWENRSTLPAPKHIKAYLMRSLRNNLLRSIKQEQRISGIAIEDHLKEVPGVSPVINDKAEVHKVQRAMEQLPARQREILHLRFYQDIRNQEISEIMGISYQSVCNLLQRAIKQMQLLVPKDVD